MCWRARPSCVTARRSAKTSGPIPEGLYPGDYLKPVGEDLKRDHDAALKGKSEAEWLPIVRQRAIDAMMAMIREDLRRAQHHPRSVRLRARVDRR